MAVSCLFLCVFWEEDVEVFVEEGKGKKRKRKGGKKGKERVGKC